jgi:hypothetical protein
MVRQSHDYRACRHVRALAALRPDDARTTARLALAEYSTGDFAGAIRLFRELIRRDALSRALYSEYIPALLYDPEQTRDSLRKESEEWPARFFSE